MNRNPEIYGSDAHHFNPARFLDENGHMVPAPPDTKEEGHISFGYGRRSCLGRQVANDSLFINVVLMLWSMNIECATDSEGNPTPIDIGESVGHGLMYVMIFFNSVKYSQHQSRRPAPFQCKVTPRFPDAISMLDSAKGN